MITIVAGASLTELAQRQQMAQTVRRLEDELEDADRLVRALTLLTYRELTRRVGTSRVGPYQVSVTPTPAGTMRISVSRLASGLPLLQTETFPWPEVPQ